MAKIVPIICPTRDHQGAMANTMFCLTSAIWSLGREPMYAQTTAYGYAAARNGCFEDTRRCLAKVGVDVKVARGFLVDDDVLLDDPMQIKAVMKEADEKHWNVVGAYLTQMGDAETRQTSIGRWVKGKHEGDKPKMELLTMVEVNQIVPWTVVDCAGLGFYYGNIPLTYKFHSDSNPFDGEDLNFFWDMPELQPRLAPLHLKHHKRVLLG